jgi:hypothetical protein
VIERTMWESQRSDNGRGGRKKKDTYIHVYMPSTKIYYGGAARRQRRQYILFESIASKETELLLYNTRRGRHSFFILVQSRLIAQQLFCLLYYSGSFTSLCVILMFSFWLCSCYISSPPMSTRHWSPMSFVHHEL